MEVIAKTAKAWFLGIPIVGHCLKPISTEIQDCQDVQTEPGNPLGRHAPFSLGEKRSTKPPIWCKSGSTAAGIMARHAQLWGVTANIPNVPNVESTGFMATGEGSLGSGSASRTSSGQTHTRSWSVFISALSDSLLQILACSERICVCFYISSKWPVCVYTWTQSL